MHILALKRTNLSTGVSSNREQSLSKPGLTHVYILAAAGKSADEYKKLYKVQQPLREYPRKDGNVLEIVAAWPQDEVWEQVEAKVEQVIELREMGEM